MTRIEEIYNALYHSNDFTLAKKIVEHVNDIKDTDGAVDMMQKVIEEIRIHAHETNTRTGK